MNINDDFGWGGTSFLATQETIEEPEIVCTAGSVAPDGARVARADSDSDTLSSLPTADVSAFEATGSLAPSEADATPDDSSLSALTLHVPPAPSSAAPPRSLTDTAAGPSPAAFHPSSAPVGDDLSDVSSGDDEEVPPPPSLPAAKPTSLSSPFLTPVTAPTNRLRGAVLCPPPSDVLSPGTFEGSPAFLPAPLREPVESGSSDEDRNEDEGDVVSPVEPELSPGRAPAAPSSAPETPASLAAGTGTGTGTAAVEDEAAGLEKEPVEPMDVSAGSVGLSLTVATPKTARAGEDGDAKACAKACATGEEREQGPKGALVIISEDEQAASDDLGEASSPVPSFFTPVPLRPMSPTRTTSVAAEAAALAAFSADHLVVAPTPTPMAARLAMRGELSQRRAAQAAHTGLDSPAGSSPRRGKLRRGKKTTKTPASPPMSPTTFYAPSPAAGATAALAHYSKLEYTPYSGPSLAAPASPFVLAASSSDASLAASFTAGGAVPSAAALRESVRVEAARTDAVRAEPAPSSRRFRLDTAPVEQKEHSEALPSPSAPAAAAPVDDVVSTKGDAKPARGKQGGPQTAASEPIALKAELKTELKTELKAEPPVPSEARARREASRSEESSVVATAAVHTTRGSSSAAAAPTPAAASGPASSAAPTPAPAAAPLPAPRAPVPVTDYIETDAFPRAEAGDKKTKNRWAEGDFTRVVLRGKTYMDDKIKIQASSPIFQTLGLVITKADQGIRHCAARLPKLRAFLDEQAANFPFFMLFTWILPGDEPLTVIQVCGRTNVRGDDPEFDALLDTYIASDDSYRSDRIKFLCSMETAPWVVTFSLNNLAGNKPALIGNKLECHHYTGPNYCEIDIDVGSSKIASALNGIIYSNAKALALHMGFMIEGRCAGELPERLLAISKFIHVAPKVVCRDLTGDEIGPLGSDAEEASRSAQNRATYAARFGATPAAVTRQ